MIAALFKEFWPHISGLVAVLAGGLGLYVKGRRDANLRNEMDEANEYIETTERIDNVDLSGDDTKWLRNRSEQ